MGSYFKGRYPKNRFFPLPSLCFWDSHFMIVYLRYPYQCSWCRYRRSFQLYRWICLGSGRWTSFGALWFRFLILDQCTMLERLLCEFGIFVELVPNIKHLNFKSKVLFHTIWNHFRSFDVNCYTCYLMLEFVCCNLDFGQIFTFISWTLYILYF